MNLAAQIAREISVLMDQDDPPPLKAVPVVQALATYRLAQAVLAVAERVELLIPPPEEKP